MLLSGIKMMAKSTQSKDYVPSEAIDVQTLSEKYEAEKSKRQRDDGALQYKELEDSACFSSLADDPFVDHEFLNSQTPALTDGQEMKIIILGAGFGGLLFAARLIEAGEKPEDIRLVDISGGFGGIWYWNRYPGIMCDTEASVYLPLLEETGYMPKHKYSYGEELRRHAERIAQYYGITNKAMFRTRVVDAKWNDDTRRWDFNMQQNRGPGHEDVKFTCSAQFFMLCNGLLNHPKAPKLPGLEHFKGDMFHTARWNYDISGGSPKDQRLTGLKEKKVGILGTGATAVQAVPKLAKFAKELYVFQRTPSSIGYRGQQETDPVKWAEITSKPGWQFERSRNFELLCQGEEADDKYLSDGWTKLKTFSPWIGRTDMPVFTPDDVQKHISNYLELDVPFQEAIRRRVDEVVHDRRTAEALKPWYPTWCKRPGFHDDYLDTFNLPHVHLVDTSQTKGVTEASSKGLIVGDQEIELDVIILSTGFRPLLKVDDPDPGAKSNTPIVGRNSLTMADKWATIGAATLHGSMTSSFPNLFLSGVTQAASSPNNTGILDVLGRQAAYIVTESQRLVRDPGRLAIEPSLDAEEGWTNEILKYDLFSSPVATCTPGYFNSEGETRKFQSPEDVLKLRRASTYMRGLPAFREILGEWRVDGKLNGIILTV